MKKENVPEIPEGGGKKFYENVRDNASRLLEEDLIIINYKEY